MKTSVYKFSGRYLDRVCVEINDYAERFNLEIVSTSIVCNAGDWYVVVVFHKGGD